MVWVSAHGLLLLGRFRSRKSLKMIWDFREVLLRGETVDVALIDDEETQEVVKGFLRQGGAHI